MGQHTHLKLGENCLLYYSLSRKMVNTRENFWNVYCFTTNQMRDGTAKDNRQTAALINYDLTRNNKLAFSSTRNLQFYRFSNTEIFLSRFQLWYHQRIDMNDILRKSDVKSRRQDQSIRPCARCWCTEPLQNM